MINALSAGISWKEPGVCAEVLRSYGEDSVSQFLHCGTTLRKKALKLKIVIVSHCAIVVFNFLH